MEPDAFFDLVHFYRLSVTDPEQHEAVNNEWSPAITTEDDKPPMVTKAAKRLPKPSWWAGTNVAEADLIASKIRGK
jgi:hypothetical protein